MDAILLENLITNTIQKEWFWKSNRLLMRYKNQHIDEVLGLPHHTTSMKGKLCITANIYLRRKAHRYFFQNKKLV